MKVVRNSDAGCILWRRQWHPTPVLLPGKSHGRGSLVGCRLWGCTESDTTECLHFHFYALEKEMATHSSVLARIIPGTGEPGGLVYGVTQNQTRLKRLSSSSSSSQGKSAIPGMDRGLHDVEWEKH